MRFILTCVALALLLATTMDAAVPDGSTLNFMQTFAELENGTPVLHEGLPAIVFRNCTFAFNREIDNAHDKRYDLGGEPLHVKHYVVFDNCTISGDYWYLMRNVVFENRVRIVKCNSLRMKFRDCTFKHLFMMSDNNIDFIDFINCTFQNGCRLIRQEVRDHVNAQGCTFSINPYLVRNPGFDTLKYVIRKTSEFPQILEVTNRTNPLDMEVRQCRFLLPDELRHDHRFVVDVGTSIYNNLRFMNNECFAPVRFAQSTIQNQFTCYGCGFHAPVLLEAFSFNTSAAKVQWSTFAGKRIGIESPETGEFITGNSVAELKDEFVYSTLVTAYSTLYAAFRSQGNKLAANNCYIEWKDIETIYLSHEVERNFTLNIYFNWLMNVFLRTFCDYGANPVKALFWSAWVMLAFGLFYFFTPYQSGLYEKESFFSRIRLYMDYFAHHKTLIEIFNEREEAPLLSSEGYRAYRQYCEAHGKRLPWYFRMFNRQIFALNISLYRLKRWWFRILSRMAGMWNHQRGLKRFFISSTIAVIVFFTILLMVFFRLLDALTTSLNAFSTLGFGEIPVRGIARYLAVIEGFVGWFLLSIFSVALISQVIQ